MASKRRVRVQECTRKIKHATEDAAYGALRKAHKAGKADGFTNVYRCKWCGGWHWGHTPNRNPFKGH
jgi:rubrerythrin